MYVQPFLCIEPFNLAATNPIQVRRAAPLIVNFSFSPLNISKFNSNISIPLTNFSIINHTIQSHHDRKAIL